MQLIFITPKQHRNRNICGTRTIIQYNTIQYKLTEMKSAVVITHYLQNQSRQWLNASSKRLRKQRTRNGRETIHGQATQLLFMAWR